MMKRTFEPLHPMACRCRDCSAPRQIARIPRRRKWRPHPIAIAVLCSGAFWALLGVVAFLAWKGAQ